MKVLHNPKLKIIDYLDERFYTFDGIKYYPSSTTILSAYPKGYGFNEWLKMQGSNADELLRKAGEQGTTIHNAIDAILNGQVISWMNKAGTPNFTIDEWKMLNRYMEFENTHKPETLAQEISLLDEELGYGGTLDRVCVIKGEIWLIDYKSSKYVWKSHFLQVSSYIALWNRMYPDLKIQRWGLMHLRANTRGEDKKGATLQGKGWKVEEAPKERDWHDFYKVFHHTKEIWNEENPNYVPKNETFPDTLQLVREVKKVTEDKKVQKVPAVEFSKKIDADAKVELKASVPAGWGEVKPELKVDDENVTIK